MKKKDYLSGSVLFLVAVVLLFEARRLTIWEKTGPGEGFFPLALSLLLGLLSLTTILQARFRGQPAREGFRILGSKKLKFILYCGSFLAFGLIFPVLGFSLTLACFLVFILKIAEKQSWKMALSVTTGSVVGCYIVFQILFTIPLPEGILSPLTQLLR